MMDININLLQWSIIFFDNKSSGSGIKNENMPNKELAEELHNQLLEDLEKGNYTHPLKKYLGY